jgi:hypothetical protein
MECSQYGSSSDVRVVISNGTEIRRFKDDGVGAERCENHEDRRQEPSIVAVRSSRETCSDS